MTSGKGGGAAHLLETQYFSLGWCFVLCNRYGFVEFAKSSDIFPSDEFTGDTFALELHQERQAFLLDHFSSRTQ